MNRGLHGKRPLAVVHIDVDSVWTLAEAFGHTKDCSDCSMYTKAVPKLLTILKEHQIPATFFCIGDDVNRSEQASVMREIIAQGHEIANHTMNHRQDFSLLNLADKRREIRDSDAILREAINKEIMGFRSPGYFLDESVIKVLEELGYLYDSSLLPTPVLPLMAVATYFLCGGIPSGKRFGRLRDLRVSQYPHFAKTNHDHSIITSKLLEIPISVIPIIRSPFHSTMVFMFGRWLFDLGIRLIYPFGIPLVYLFHAVDFLPPTDNIAVKMHPTLRKGFSERYTKIDYMLKIIKSQFEVVSTSSFARHFAYSL